MNNSVMADLKKSNRIFMQNLSELIEYNILPNGNLLPVETLSYDLAKLMDQYAGIDALHVLEDSNLTSISTRCLAYKGYKTFTIRNSRDSGAKTEFEKRAEAIDSGGMIMYPYLSVMIYHDNGVLLHAAATRTVDLINYVRENKRINRTTNASFLWATFNEVKAAYPDSTVVHDFSLTLFQ